MENDRYNANPPPCPPQQNWVLMLLSSIQPKLTSFAVWIYIYILFVRSFCFVFLYSYCEIRCVPWLQQPRCLPWIIHKCNLNNRSRKDVGRKNTPSFEGSCNCFKCQWDSNYAFQYCFSKSNRVRSWGRESNANLAIHIKVPSPLSIIFKLHSLFIAL